MAGVDVVKHQLPPSSHIDWCHNQPTYQNDHIILVVIYEIILHKV